MKTYSKKEIDKFTEKIIKPAMRKLLTKAIKDAYRESIKL